MWRFLLPALATTAALVVLFAGALGDLKSLTDLSIMVGAEPSHAPPEPVPAPPVGPATAAVTELQSRDALQRQITYLQKQASDLQNQIAQRSHDHEQRSRDVESGRSELDGVRQGLEAMQAETDKLRQDIDALRQQRKAEEDALARDKAHEKQMATANAPQRPPAPKPAPSPLTLAPAPAEPSAAQQLSNARQWLATGRPDEARYILAMVQTQMVLRPVTPNHPLAEGDNRFATDIGTAIRWLDMGANGQAMQAISRAINHADAAETLPSPWAGYPGQPSGR
jgi:hypothetical protein